MTRRRRILALAPLLALLLACATLAEEPQHHYFTTSDGVKIHYITLGSEGSYVVLHHGYTSSAEGNWFRNGVAEALARNHRVVAIDARNHGRSDKPTPRGPGIAGDVVELLDHMGIEKAHLHGYSMGGSITARVLATHPERLITASFGGSGIRESDPQWVARVPPEPVGSDPDEVQVRRGLRIRSMMDNGATREEAEAAVDAQMREPPSRPASPPTTVRRRTPLEIDIPSLDIPLLAINGEFDHPYSKTFRLWREARSFTNVILPGKGHLTAIAGSFMPPEYLESLVRFIDANDP